MGKSYRWWSVFKITGETSVTLFLIVILISLLYMEFCMHNKQLDVQDHYFNGIKAREDEPAEVILKRFKREVINTGTLTELKKREFFEKPSVIKKRAKEVAARKKYRKKFVFNAE